MFLQVPVAENVLMCGTPAALASGGAGGPQKRDEGIWEMFESWRLWLPTRFVMATLARVF